jgi:hypothetical protein
VNLTRLVKTTRYKHTDSLSSSTSNAEMGWTRRVSIETIKLQTRGRGSKDLGTRSETTRAEIRDNLSDQRQPPPMQNPYYDTSASYPSASPYPSQLNMPPQLWQSHTPSMSRGMMGPCRSGRSSQMKRSASMSSLHSPRPQSSRDEMSEYEDMQRDPRHSSTPEHQSRSDCAFSSAIASWDCKQ